MNSLLVHLPGVTISFSNVHVNTQDIDHVMVINQQFSYKNLLQEVENRELTGSVSLISKNPIESFKEFCQQFKVIAAAGGLVESPNGNFLLIHRNGSWDLPKGKMEKGETIEEAALREVEEECGIGNLSLGEKLCITHHTYNIDGKRILKESHWYKMKAQEESVLIPQSEEGIDQAVWCSKEDSEAKLLSSFPTLAEVWMSL